MMRRHSAAVSFLVLCASGCIYDGYKAATEPPQPAVAPPHKPVNATRSPSRWVGLWADASGARVRVGTDGRFTADLYGETRQFGYARWRDHDQAEGELLLDVWSGERSEFIQDGKHVVATNAPNGAAELPTFCYTLAIRLDANTDELLLEYRCEERIKRHRLVRVDRAAFERVPTATVGPVDER